MRSTNKYFRSTSISTLRTIVLFLVSKAWYEAIPTKTYHHPIYKCTIHVYIYIYIYIYTYICIYIYPCILNANQHSLVVDLQYPILDGWRTNFGFKPPSLPKSQIFLDCQHLPTKYYISISSGLIRLDP